MLHDITLQALKDIVGPGGWLETTADTAPYCHDFRNLYAGTTPLVLRPDSVHGVANILTLCTSSRISVVPYGGNTSYCGGATPRAKHAEIVLSLERLKRIRDVDAAGYTITVDAGCTLASVQAAATESRRYFPLSLGSEGTCQIGGNLSTNAGGTAVLRYGMMRDLVLGLEVVRPDGSVLNQLTKLRKDNTGYDCKQLFLGAEGTLGVITGACLKLFSQPNDYITALIAVDGLAAAVQLLETIRNQFGDSLEAFEYIPRAAYELVLKHCSQTVFPFDHPYSGYVLLELATSALASEYTALLESFLEVHLADRTIRDVVLARSGLQRDNLWLLRESIPRAQTLEGASIKHDISLPIAQLGPFSDKARSIIDRLLPQARVVAYGHVGDGNLHFNISPPVNTIKGSTEERAFLSRQKDVTCELLDLVTSFNGSFSAEHGIGQLKVPELERYEDPTALQLMRVIKQAIDPLNIMNPGKVIASLPVKRLET